MKSIRIAVIAVLTLGLAAPAQAATSGPINPRTACLLSSCGADIVSFTTGTPVAQSIFEGLQNIETASDGKVWFSGIGQNNAAGVVGYIKPWDKAAGVHLCDSSLLTHESDTFQPYTLVPADSGSMDAVGLQSGVVHFNSTCTSATYPSVRPTNGNRASARDVNGDIWVGYDGASKIVNLNTDVEISNTWTADMTSGPDGNMWAIDDAHNMVMTWDPNNATVSYQALSLSFCTPQAIASDHERFLWVSCSIADTLVRIDTASGHVGERAYYGVPTGGGLGLPGITVGDDGVVWLTDQGDHAVKAFNEIATGTGGENLNFVNMSKPEWATDIPMLRGITHDLDNNAWFINAADATINFIGINAVGPKPTDPTEPSEPVEKTTKPTCSSHSQWTVYFANRSAKLSKAAKSTLDCVATQVGKAKAIKIYGYTMTNKKSAASKLANKKLAKKRAQAVRKYLRTKGVKAKVIVIAKGAVNPVSKSDQSKNRRVVIVPKYMRLPSF